MKRVIHLDCIGMLLLLFCVAGCVSKKEANLEAQRAYQAGQQQGAQQWQAKQPPQVYVHGPVRNPIVPFTDDLTLAKAIVASNYTGFMNPVLVRVIRNGQVVVEMKGVDLLHGQDFPLQPGDTIDLGL